MPITDALMRGLPKVPRENVKPVHNLAVHEALRYAMSARGREVARKADSSIMSSATGLGVAGADRVADAQVAQPRWVRSQEADHLSVADGLIRRAIYGFPESYVGDGWRTDDGTDRDVTAEVDDPDGLDLENRLLIGDQGARQYGGAWLWMIGEGVEDFSEELKPGTKLIAIHPLFAPEVKAIQWESDPRKRDWGGGLYYSLTPRRYGIGTMVGAGRVHKSHLVYIPGLTRIPGQNVALLPDYDISVPQAYWTAISHLGLTHQSLATAALEKSMLNLHLSGGNSLMAGEATEQATDALELWSMARSNLKVNVTTGEDKLSRVDANLTGLPEIVETMQLRVTPIEGVPMQYWFGNLRSGIGGSDTVSQDMWDEYRQKKRVRHLAPIIRQVYRQHYGPSRTRTLEWAPIRVPTPKERAETSEILARRDAILINDAGWLRPDESRARFEGEVELEEPVLATDDGEDADAAAWAEEMDVQFGPDPGADEDAPTAPIGDADRYKIPEAARNNARKVLQWREEHGDEVKGMTEVGWRRARQLAENTHVGIETVRKMAGFNRHRKNNEISKENEATPWKDAGRVAWLGWGGTTGIDWARGITGADKE